MVPSSIIVYNVCRDAKNANCARWRLQKKNPPIGFSPRRRERDRARARALKSILSRTRQLFASRPFSVTLEKHDEYHGKSKTAVHSRSQRTSAELPSSPAFSCAFSISKPDLGWTAHARKRQQITNVFRHTGYRVNYTRVSRVSRK